MFRLDDTLTVYPHCPAIDLETSINVPAILVEQALGMNPLPWPTSTRAPTCTRCWRLARSRALWVRVPALASGGAPAGEDRRGLRGLAALAHRCAQDL